MNIGEFFKLVVGGVAAATGAGFAFGGCESPPELPTQEPPQAVRDTTPRPKRPARRVSEPVANLENWENKTEPVAEGEPEPTGPKNQHLLDELTPYDAWQTHDIEKRNEIGFLKNFRDYQTGLDLAGSLREYERARSNTDYMARRTNLAYANMRGAEVSLDTWKTDVKINREMIQLCGELENKTKTAEDVDSMLEEARSDYEDARRDYDSELEHSTAERGVVDANAGAYQRLIEAHLKVTALKGIKTVVDAYLGVGMEPNDMQDSIELFRRANTGIQTNSIPRAQQTVLRSRAVYQAADREFKQIEAAEKEYKRDHVDPKQS